MPEGVITKSDLSKSEGMPKASLPNRIVKVLSGTERAGAIISGSFILIMMVMTTLDVFLRYVFNSPITGNYELQPLLLIGVVFLAASSIQAKRSHIVLDLISSHLSEGNQSAIRLFSDLIFLIFAALICWQFAMATQTAWITHDYYWGTAKFPLWPPYLIITLGTALLGIRLIEQLIGSPLWRKASGLSLPFRTIRVILVALVAVLLLAGILMAINAHVQPVTVGTIAIGMFLVLMFLGTPVSICLGLTAIIGFWIMRGGASALGIAGSTPFSAVGQYTMTVMPLFIIMGSFAALAGFAEEGFKLAKRWMEDIPGGIIHATIIGACAFGAASGSGAATVAILAKVAIPEMLKQGVKKGMAIGVVASAATLDIMIPPSTAFVIYGMLTGTSIGKLLIAGIIPGLIGAGMIMIMVAVRCKIDPSQYGHEPGTHTPWKTRFASIPRAWGLLFIAVVVMGGLYLGVFTPTEAGAIGAFAALLGVLATRKGGLRSISQVLFESGGLTSQIMLIMLGGMMFSYMMSITHLPADLSNWIASFKMAPIVIIIIIMAIYFLLGTFMDDLSLMIATLPIIFPLIIKLGFNPVWFGVLMVQNIQIGVVSPPYGMNLFILKGILKDTPMGEIFRGVMWFLIPLIATMALYIAFPQIVLWLPGMMK
jgi:tripartite ATP-independent transporter DctM subunit